MPLMIAPLKLSEPPPSFSSNAKSRDEQPGFSQVLGQHMEQRGTASKEPVAAKQTAPAKNVNPVDKKVTADPAPSVQPTVTANNAGDVACMPVPAPLQHPAELIPPQVLGNSVTVKTVLADASLADEAAIQAPTLKIAANTLAAKDEPTTPAIDQPTVADPTLAALPQAVPALPVPPAPAHAVDPQGSALNRETSPTNIAPPSSTKLDRAPAQDRFAPVAKEPAPASTPEGDKTATSDNALASSNGETLKSAPRFEAPTQTNSRPDFKTTDQTTPIIASTPAQATAALNVMPERASFDRELQQSFKVEGLHVIAGSPHLAPPSTSVTSLPAAASIIPEMRVPGQVDTPEFAHGLAACVTVLARDGIQEARLHLHPAEMGPITVQIALDGTQARVDFSAEVAATRHAIEAGLPQLASSLREAGLTLSGGGVFQQHASHQRSADPGPGGRNAGESANDDGLTSAAERPVVRRVSVGQVDLYA